MVSSSSVEQNGNLGRLNGNSNSDLYLDKMASGTQTDIALTPDIITTGDYYDDSLQWQGTSLSMNDITNGHSVSGTDASYSIANTMSQISLGVGAANTVGNKYTTYWVRIGGHLQMGEPQQ